MSFVSSLPFVLAVFAIGFVYWYVHYVARGPIWADRSLAAVFAVGLGALIAAALS